MSKIGNLKNFGGADFVDAPVLPGPTFTSEFKAAVPRSLGLMVQGIGQGIEDVTPWEDNPIKRYGQAVVERNPSQINSLEDIGEHPLAALGSGVGNAVGFMVPGGAIGAAGKAYGLSRGAMYAAQTANAATPSYAGIREQQLRDGNNSFSDIATAGMGALGVGAIENMFGMQSLPLVRNLLGLGERLVGKEALRASIKELGPTAVLSGLKDLAKSTLGEGFEEILQNPIEQAAAYQDPMSDESLRDTIFSGAMGALGGLGLGGVGGVHAYARHRGLQNQLAPYADPSAPTDLLRAMDNRDIRMDELGRASGVDASMQPFYDQAAARDAEIARQMELPDTEPTNWQDRVAEVQGIESDPVNYLVGTRKRDFKKPHAVEKPFVPTARDLALAAATEQTVAPIDPAVSLTAKHFLNTLDIPVIQTIANNPNAPKLQRAAATLALQRKVNEDQNQNVNAQTQEATVNAVPVPAQPAQGSSAVGQQPAQAEGQGEVTARQVLESLIAKIPGKIQQRDVGQYFGLLTGEETDTAVLAERRGVSRQATHDSLQRGLKALRKVADAQGVSLEALQQQIAEENDTGLTVSQQEVLNDTQTSELDEGDLGTNLTVKDNTKKSFGETRRYIDPEQAFQDTMRRTNGDANQANLARARANANNTELAAMDAAEGPLEEKVAGQTIAPKYDHSPEDVAKAKDLWDELQEDLGTVAWDTLTQEQKDSYTQKTRDILNAPTAIPDYAALDRHAQYLSGEHQNETGRPDTRPAEQDAGNDEGIRGDQQVVQNEPTAATPPVTGNAEKTGGKKQKVKKAKPAAPSAESQWNVLAGQLGITTWKGLNDTQRGAIEDALASGDQTRIEAAADAVVMQLNDVEDVQYSEGQQTENPSTVASITKSLKSAFFSPAKFDQLVKVFATQAEAVAAVGDEGLKRTSEKGSVITGFAYDGKVYLIAENIPQGREMGVFLHEVGVHLGMEKLIGKANMQWLASKVESWAGRDDGSIESHVAKWAVQKAKDSSSDEAYKQEELIAYMVEGLNGLGITPQAAGKSEGHQWFRKLWAAAKAALRRLGFKNPNFSGQNLVDLAYGAADLELEGAWHGTAADFRNFNHDYMGTGEGAQAYGWGTYLAQRVGIAKEYWKADVLRKGSVNGRRFLGDYPRLQALEAAAEKDDLLGFDSLGEIIIAARQDGMANMMRHFDMSVELRNLLTDYLKWSRTAPEGSLMRVASNVRDEEFLDWDKPLREQSEYVQQILVDAGTQVVRRGGSGPLGIQFVKGMTGAEFYQRLSGKRNVGDSSDFDAMNKGSKKAASEYLDSIGIKGIKFLDQSSRNQPAGVKVVKQDLGDMWGKILSDDGKKPYRLAYTLSDGSLAGNVDNKFYATEEEAERAATSARNTLKQTHNLVIFNDKNVVRAMTEIGASPERIKFSDASEKALGSMSQAAFAHALSDAAKDRGLIGQVMSLGTIPARTRDAMMREVLRRSAMPTYVQGELRFSEADVKAIGTMASIADKLAPAKTEAGDFWAKLKPKLMTIHQLVDQYGSKLKSLGAYVKSIDSMEQFQQQLATGAHPIVLKWQGLDKGVRKSLHRVMLDATMWGIHPDKPIEAGVDAAKYHDLKNRFNALPSEAKEVYRQSRDYLSNMWSQRVTVFDNLVKSAYDRLIENDPGNRTKLEAKRDKLIADHTKAVHSIKGPYFPLLRFGDYLTIGKSKAYTELEAQIESAEGAERKTLEEKLQVMKKDPKHYAVFASEYKSAAESKGAELAAAGMTTKTQLAEEHANALSPFSSSGLDKLRSIFNTQFDKGTSNKLDRLLTEVYISSLPEHTALQRQLKRIGVEGAEENQLRAFARAVEQDSFHLSRMKYNDEISSLLFDVSAEAKEAGVAYQHVTNNLKQRIDLDFQYQRTPVLSMLGRLSSFWHLGVSPAYLFTNSTQPWMIALPSIAGKYGGMRSTLKEMTRAWNDAKNMIIQSKKDGAFADIKFDVLDSADERKMLQTIRDLGQIDITINFDLGNVAESISPALLKLQKSLAWANHHIEVSNRITTALTAFRMARKNGQSIEDATNFAYKQVIDTQLDYSNANAAYFMKSQHLGGLNKLIMQFRKYQQGMFYLIANNAKLAFQGDKQALASLMYLMAMQGAFAGAAGIPFMSMALFLAGFGVDDDDPDGDAETQFRNLLADIMGVDAARVFYKGLPAMLGMDLSKRIGLGDVWDPTPFYDMKDFKKAKTGKDAVGGAVFALAGPAVGTLSNFADAAIMAESGQLGKAAEKMLPKAAADLFRAYRYDTEGLTTRTGSPVMGADKFSAGDILQRGLGFSPVTESEHYEAQSAKMDTQARIKDRREQLVASYARYKMVGEPEDVAAMDQAVQNWNAKHPDKGERIDRSTLLKAVQQRKKGLSQTDEAGVRFTKSERYLKGIDRFAGAS